MEKILKISKKIVSLTLILFGLWIVLGGTNVVLASNAGIGPSTGGSGPSTGGSGPSAGGSGGTGSGGTITINPTAQLPKDAIGLLNAVINFLTLKIAPPLIALVVIWAAFMFLTAGGNPKNIGKAKQALLYAVIGAVIIIIGQGIVLIIQNFIESVPPSSTSLIITFPSNLS